MEALAAALRAAEEQRDRAEQEADFFKEMMEETAARAKMSEAEVAAIGAEVRAKREPVYEEQPDDEED